MARAHGVPSERGRRPDGLELIGGYVGDSSADSPSGADSTMGKKRGHVHSLNKQGPLSVWMNSEWRHHEQRLARLASRSIQRIAERLGFVMALPVGRVCHLDIGSLGSPLSRSKDLSCLVIRADTRQVDRVGCCPNATIAKAEPVKIIFSSCPIHPGCTIEVIFGEEAEGRIPFPDPALRRDAERDFQELVPIGVNHLGGQDSGYLGLAARLNVTQRRTSSGPEMADRSVDGPAPATRSLPSRTPRPGLKRGVLTFLIMFVLAVSGIATAGVLAGAKDDKAEGNEQDHKAEGNEQDDGVHGGPIERFHTAGSCDLTAVSSLPGNWTHGDYVSAVAANGTPAQIREAAHSDCGKPMVAVGHGGGPPEHALEHMAAGKAHAGGKAEDEGWETPGSQHH